MIGTFLRSEKTTAGGLRLEHDGCCFVIPGGHFEKTKLGNIYMLETLSSRPLKHDDQGKSEPPGRPAVTSGVWLSCCISGIGGFGL